MHPQQINSFVFILHIAIITHCLYSIFFFSANKQRFNIWLIILFGSSFLAKAVPVLAPFLRNYQELIVFISNPSFSILLFPCVYLYVKYLLDDNTVFLSKRTLIHFVPFIAFYLMFTIYGKPPLPLKLAHNIGHTLPQENPGKVFLLFPISYFIISIFYLIKTFKKVKKHEQSYQQHLADNSTFSTLSWLKPLLIIMLIQIVLFVLGHTPIPFIPIPFWVAPFGVLLLLFTISFFASQQHPLVEQTIPISIDTETKTTLHEKAIQISNIKAKYLAKFSSYIKEYKPYLEPDIRLGILAKKVKIPQQELSKLINEHYQQNFFQFINQRRVEYACELLQNKAYNKYTLVAIGKEAGFNSKTTFNTSFKSVTGVSPSEYQKGSSDA